MALNEKFKNRERIRSRKEIDALFQQGKRYFGRYCTLVTLENGQTFNRMVISVSRRVGNAVLRNREKRICREIYRRHKGELKEGNDILILVKGIEEGFERRKMEIIGLFRQARLSG